MTKHKVPDPYDIRTYNPEHLATLRTFQEQVETLSPEEQTWRALYDAFKAAGYTLRHRYSVPNANQPFWQWDLPGNEHVDFRQFEDSIYSPARLNVMDATDTKTGRRVFLKRVKGSSSELHIAKRLQTFDRGDAMNHHVPILNILQGGEFQDLAYIVMPFLRPLDNPPFETVSNVVDLVDQLLEGLEFMHSKGIAHRDCAYKNIMMDASSLYPTGFHPVRLDNDPSGLAPAEVLSREGHSVRYYFVDFGISTSVEPGRSCLVLGRHGLDQEVPELSLEVPYDPFKVDIFIIGNLLNSVAYNKYPNVSFLLPLIIAMTQVEPSRRPSAAEAHTQWKQIRNKLSFLRLHSRLQRQGEFWLQRVVLDSWSMGRRVVSWLIEFPG